MLSWRLELAGPHGALAAHSWQGWRMQPLGKQCHLGWIKSRKTKEGKGCVPSVDHSSSPTETVSHGFRGERSCHFLHCLQTRTRLGLSSFYQLQAPGERTGRRFSSRRYFSRQELCIPFFFFFLDITSTFSPFPSPFWSWEGAERRRLARVQLESFVNLAFG